MPSEEVRVDSVGKGQIEANHDENDDEVKQIVRLPQCIIIIKKDF